MHLKDYTDKHSQLALAQDIEAAPSFVNQWVNGKRPVPPAFCVSIERATKGSVKRWDLRPDDWHRIWPELIGTEGSPEIPQAIATGG